MKHTIGLITVILSVVFLCACSKNLDRKIYGTIVSKKNGQPVANEKFVLATDKQSGFLFNKKHGNAHKYPFSTNRNGYFEIIFHAETGSRVYIAIGAAIQIGDPFQGAIWAISSISKKETNINVGTVQY